MSPEERQQFRKQRQQRHQGKALDQKFKNSTPKQRQKFRKKMQSMTPKQRQKFRKRMQNRSSQ